ncbi:DUF6477 family protein [Yoonia sp.]|uniref:DUF6477 family protein n=1 Tax=Yoonia sp. TaxID=2212373 RepID=UPI003F6C19C0
MQDLQTRITTLKRPALLARAARFGVDEYRRDIHLRRILQADPLPRSAEAVMRLLDLEQDAEYRRKSRDGSYSAARHVELLIAIAGEARIMQASRLRLM